MLAEVSRVLKKKGYYICISYGDSDIRNHYFEGENYKWARLPQCPYKIFKPNIDETEKIIVVNDKDK
jgi:ubiquinone/menaquinone biosynthesis C-methylase UbiE